MKLSLPPVNPLAYLPIEIGDKSKQISIVPYNIVNIMLTGKLLTLFMMHSAETQYVFSIGIRAFLRQMAEFNLFCCLNSTEAVNIYQRTEINKDLKVFKMNNAMQVKYNDKSFIVYRKMLIRLFEEAQTTIRFPSEAAKLAAQKVLVAQKLLTVV